MPSPSPPRWAEPRWARLLLVCAVVLVYGQTLRGGFLAWDDTRYIVESTPLHALTLENLAAIWNPAAPRALFGHEYLPLKETSFALDWAVWGGRALGFHLTNLVLYALTALLVHALLRDVLHDAVGALAGALLFALHPLHVESVAWIYGRKELLSGLLVLLAWRAAGRRRAGVALGCYLLALLAKATVVFFPLLLLLPQPGRDDPPRRRLLWAAGFAVPTALYLALTIALGARHGVIREDVVRSVGGALWTGLCLPGWYFVKLLVPWPLYATYPVGQTRVVLDAWHLAGLLGTGGWLALAWASRRRPTLRLAVAWGALSLLPVLNVLPRGIVFAERYAYLAVFGLALAAGAGVAQARARAGGRGPLAAAALAGVLALLGALSGLRAAEWRSDFALWSAEAQRRRGDGFATLRLSDALAESGRTAEAEHLLRALLASDPDEARVHTALGGLLAARGDPAALAHLARACELSPRRPSPRIRLGLALARAGRHAEAVAAFDEALAIDPGHMAARFNRALALEPLDPARAAEAWRDYLAASEGVPGEASSRAVARDRLARLGG